MTEQLNTTPDNTVEQPNVWSAEAAQERDRAARPTAENPRLFDIEDALKVVSFEQIAGEKLSGLVTGYFYNDSGEKVNIVAPSSESRQKLEARGGSTSDGYIRVPESFVGTQIESNTQTPEKKEAPDVSENMADNLGGTAIEAATASNYDDLFDEDREFGSVEDAAVYTESEDERLTRERRARDEAKAALDRVGRSEMN